MMSMIYEFDVHLKDVGEKVYRSLQIDGSATFDEFHELLQVAFGWYDLHLYAFEIKRSNGQTIEDVEISLDDDLEEMGFFYNPREVYDAKKEKLSDWFKTTNDRVIYTYDFGDHWEHEITFKKKIKPVVNETYPRCIDAKNHAPEEDSRWEVIEGIQDLVEEDSEGLIFDINEEIQGLPLLSYSEQSIDETLDSWYHLLSASKEYLQLKPWEKLSDHEIFMIRNEGNIPDLFCSILGMSEEVYGLAVYIGRKGFSTIVDVLNEEDTFFNLLQKQHSLLLSFEDRNDLDRRDYDFVKTYEIPFWGRKSWPLFRKVEPGYFPWYIEDQQDADLLLLAIQQAKVIIEEREKGLKLPNLLEGTVFARVAKQKNGKIKYENDVINVSDIVEVKDQAAIPMAISEFELYKINKMKKQKPFVIEYSAQYIDVPIQESDDIRPELPLFLSATDHSGKQIFHHELCQEKISPKLIQEDFVEFLLSIDGHPEAVLVTEDIYALLQPLLKHLNIHVEIRKRLPVTEFLITDLMEQMENMDPF